MSRRVYRKQRFVYYSLKVIGLCPCKLDSQGTLRPCYKGSLYNVLLACVCLCISERALIARFFIVVPKENAMSTLVDAIALAIQTLTIVHCLLNFAFGQKRLMKMLDEFKRVERNFGEIVKIGCSDVDPMDAGVWLAGLSLLYAPISFLDHTRFLITGILSLKDILFWSFFQGLFVVVIVGFLVYLVGLNVVLHYLRQLNLALLKTPEIGTRVEDIEMLHVQLIDIASELTEFFRFTILGTIINNFIHVSISCYRANLFLIHEDSWSVMDILDFNSLAFWLMTKVLMLYLTCALADAVVEQANRTVNLVNVAFVKLKRRDREHYWKVNKISDSFFHVKFRVSIYGLFCLDYKCFQNIVTVILMYTVTMYQLDQSDIKTV